MEKEADWNVGKLLGMSSAYWRSGVIHAGVRLDVFSLIGSEWMTADEMTAKLSGDSRGVSGLLNALVALGLLQKEQDRYGNTPFSTEIMVRESPRYIGHIIMHHHHLVDGWAQLDQAVLSGRPVETRSYGEGVERESFLMGMFNLAMGLAPGFADSFILCAVVD